MSENKWILTNEEWEILREEARIKAEVIKYLRKNERADSKILSRIADVEQEKMADFLCLMKDKGFLECFVDNGNVFYRLERILPEEEFEFISNSPRGTHPFIKFKRASDFLKLVKEITGKEIDRNRITFFRENRTDLEKIRKYLPDQVSVIVTNAGTLTEDEKKPSTCLILIKDSVVYGYYIGALV